MPDITKDTRNFDPATRGMTTQEVADKQASDRGGAPHPSTIAPTKPVGPSIHPSSPGGRSYGAPVGPVILK